MVASCLRGAFPPVDLRAVCLVLAIFCHPKLGNIPKPANAESTHMKRRVASSPSGLIWVFAFDYASSLKSRDFRHRRQSAKFPEREIPRAPKRGPRIVALRGDFRLMSFLLIIQLVVTR